jgi:hypothetical protein
MSTAIFVQTYSQLLKPGGFLICKTALSWDVYERATPTSTGALQRSEILAIFGEVRMMHHQERAVRNRGVVEYVGIKSLELFCEH